MIDTIVNSFDIWTDAQGVKSRTRVKSVDNISLEGISGLRALIIELALRGKLIPQDASNEPANILLKKIVLEKDKLIAEGKIPKQKSLNKIEQAKMPYTLPDGWAWAWFSDSYFFQEGPGIRNWQFRSSGIKLLNVQNIVGDKLILANTDKYIDAEEYQQKYLHFTIEEDDLVFASSGGSWGKSAFFHDPGYKVIVNTSTIRMHPFLEDSPRNYLKLFLDSKLFKDQMIEQLVGIQPNFGSTHLFKILVPVPPSKEQYLIASKVDELMGFCDKLEKEQFNNLKTHQVLVKTLLETLPQAIDANELKAAWARMSAHFDTLFCTDDSIDQLKQTIIQLAVMGKLVKQDPNDEPASELITQISKAKEQLIEKRKIKKTRSVDTINIENCTWLHPSSWSEIELQDLFQFIDYRGRTPEKSKKGKRLITAKNIKMGFIANNPVEYVSNEFYKNWMVRGFPKTGDILLVTEGHTIGFAAKVNLDFEFALAQRTICFQPFIDTDTTYFLYLFMTPQFQMILKDNQTGSAAEGIKASKLKRINIPFPPLAEQHRIVAKIKELFTLCESLIERIQKSQDIKVLLSRTMVENAVQ